MSKTCSIGLRGKWIIRLSDVGTKVIEELRDEFTYDNPKYYALQKMGVPYWQEPKVITTAELSEDCLFLPRGGSKRISRILKENGFDSLDIRDYRTEGLRELKGGIPELKVQLRDYQVHLRDAAIEKQNCMLQAPTGCLSGDTVVSINRAGICRKMRLDRVVCSFNGGMYGNKRWDVSIPTMIRAPMSDGTVRLCRVIGAVCSGQKPLYRVHCDDGKFVTATSDHRFLTPFGWFRLDELSGFDFLMMDCDPTELSELRTSKPKKGWYKLRAARHHPFVSRKGVNPRKGGWTVPEHRLIAEADMNGMALDEFIRAIELQRPGLKFLDPKIYTVHHKDRNPRNNTIENLSILTHQEHRIEHRGENAEHLRSRLIPVRIKSIEYVGEDLTYDLEIDRASAFIANSIAVHNSGKTLVALAIASRLNLPTLAIVHNRALFEQWVERAEKDLGIPKSEVGLIQGSTRKIKPLTIAMQPTLASRGVDKTLAKTFGVVICDETNLFAAATFLEVVQSFESKYRIGVSADVSRKDRKDFLLRDAFGDVAAEVLRSDLEDQGHIHDVAVRVTETAFEAPWYGLPDDDCSNGKEIDFNRLLDEMAGDAGREGTVLRLVKREVQKREPTLVMVHHRDHAIKYDRLLSKAGFRVGLMIGGTSDRMNFERAKNGITCGAIDLVVGTYAAISTGIDLPSVTSVVCATPIAGNKQLFTQVRGRVCRMSQGKTGAKLLYVWDKLVYPNHYKNLVRWNRDVSLESILFLVQIDELVRIDLVSDKTPVSCGRRRI